ncbi:MAG: hypothetical protein Q9226_005907 [Calogaya cf. arnoldii]
MARNIGITHVLRSVLVIYSLLFAYASSTCYHDSGTIAEDYIPCNASAIGTTHCCANGHTCLSTGLCLVSWDTSVNTGSCTDRSWDSEACFRMCPGALGALNTLYRCDENQWCCSLGGNTTTCCQDPNVELFKPNSVNDPSRVMGGSAFVPGYTIAPVAALKAVESSNGSESASDKSVSDESASQASGECPASGDDAMKAGLGAGLGIGMPLIAALGTLLFFLLREKRINRELRQNTGVITGVPDVQAHHPRTNNSEKYNNPQELYADFGTAELSNGVGKVQLPA